MRGHYIAMIPPSMNETESLLHVNSPKGTTQMPFPKHQRGTLRPSPTMRVRFPDGEVIQMNRATRRKNKLYGDRVKAGGAK